MRKLITLIALVACTNVFGYSVVDSMYTSAKLDLMAARDPASQDNQYCLMNENQEIFAKSCYSTIELCNKRMEFWKDLPGAKTHVCVKI